MSSFVVSCSYTATKIRQPWLGTSRSFGALFGDCSARCPLVYTSEYVIATKRMSCRAARGEASLEGVTLTHPTSRERGLIQLLTKPKPALAIPELVIDRHQAPWQWQLRFKWHLQVSNLHISVPQNFLLRCPLLQHSRKLSDRVQLQCDYICGFNGVLCYLTYRPFSALC